MASQRPSSRSRPRRTWLLSGSFRTRVSGEIRTRCVGSPNATSRPPRSSDSSRIRTLQTRAAAPPRAEQLAKPTFPSGELPLPMGEGWGEGGVGARTLPLVGHPHPRFARPLPEGEAVTARGSLMQIVTWAGAPRTLSRIEHARVLVLPGHADDGPERVTLCTGVLVPLLPRELIVRYSSATPTSAFTCARVRAQSGFDPGFPPRRPRSGKLPLWDVDANAC